MIRVFLVDEQAAVRSGLRMRLSIEPDLSVVGEAADGERAITMALELQPDIVLMDIGLPSVDGVSATRAIRQLAPHISVILLALRSDPSTRARADSAGAAALVEKTAGETALLAAVRNVVQQRGAGGRS